MNDKYNTNIDGQIDVEDKEDIRYIYYILHG